ncbi:MAG: Transcription initiation factor TFIIIB [Methanophagales archaeon]|nr:hypothetical protein [Methanophagales archaeon]MCU4140359.1 Transcription initiation factor TFIIIB [Methanophagales archaeon]
MRGVVGREVGEEGEKRERSERERAGREERRGVTKKSEHLSRKEEEERERLQRISERLRKRRVSNLRRHRLTASAEIERISAMLSIPERIKEESLSIYQQAWERDLIHGRSVEKMVAASVYAACRRNRIPMTLDELEKATNVARKDIVRACKVLAGRLSLSLPPVSPIEYVHRFCEKLNLKGRVREKAEEIVRKALEKNITSGRGPPSIAASAVYIAAILCGKRQTQKAVAEVAGVTEVTLRVRYKELARKLQIELHN